MPKARKTFVKPGGMAQKITDYEMIKRETIERNNDAMKSRGLQPLSNLLFGFIQTTTSTTAEKRNVDCVDNDDKDYYPPENEEGLSSSSDDEEFYGSQAKKVIPPTCVISSYFELFDI